MHPHHRTSVLVVAFGLVVAACVWTTQGSAAIQPTIKQARTAPTRPLEAIPAPTPVASTDLVYEQVQNELAAELAALTAQQAQDLADQLSAAAQRLQNAPQSPPAASTGSYRLDCNDPDVQATIRSIFGDQAEHALQVAGHESGCGAGAYNPSGASGAFQLLGHQDLLDQVCPGVPNNAFDLRCNTLAAKILYDGSGWAPWAASGG